jgi:hypothetical protein
MEEEERIKVASVINHSDLPYKAKSYTAEDKKDSDETQLA